MTALVQPILKPDAKLMLDHIEHLFGGFLDGYHDGLIELAWTDTRPASDGKYKLKNARLFATDQFEELVDEAARLNSQPMCNVYIGAWLRKPDTARDKRTTDADAWAMTCAYTDLDDPGTTSRAKDVYLDTKPTWITMTGLHPHGRAQLWWRLAEPITDHARGEAIIRGITAPMGGDDSIHNPGRVMRLAGSLAWATKPGRQLELTTRAPLKKPGYPLYAIEHLEQVFEPIHEAAKGSVNAEADDTKRTANSLGLLGNVNDGREKYMRDTALALLIEFIGQNGTEPSAQQLFDVAWPQYAANTDLSRPGRGKEELAEKCRYTLKRFQEGRIKGVKDLDQAIEVYEKKQKARAQAGIEAPKLLPTPDPSAISATPFKWVAPTAIPPREWIYGQHYIRRFISSTVAPGGLGKSSLIIAEALAIGTGRPLLGVAIDQRTNVWLWNGEDPQDELNRRVMATAMHYKLTEKDIEGRLFVDNGRQMPIIVAERTRDGVVIQAPVVDQVIATIQDNAIGVMIVDPFIACHRVTDNDNNEIERVAKIWAAIADVTGCAIELVHHVRKTTGNEIQVEDGRGAGALLAATRAARTLNRMTAEEGEKAGVADHRFFFRADDGKANLAPPSANAKWFKLVSYDLMNATKDRPSDKIGVVTQWGWPDCMDGVTPSDMELVREKTRTGKWRADAQAKEWVGVAIMDVLGLEDTPAARAKAKGIQSVWTGSKALKVTIEKDTDRKEKKFVRPGDFND